MKKAKKRLAVVLVLVVAVNMLLQGGINTLAQAKPLEGSKDNSVKSEKSMSDKGKAPEKKQDNSKEKKNVKPSDPKKEEKGRINKDKKDQNDKNKNDKKDNKDGDKKDTDSDHQKDKKDDQDKKEHSKNPGAAIDKTKKGNDIVAKVNAPAGAFTKGTTAEISTLSADSKKVAYDITFTDADNKEVQPQAGTPVKVSFAIGNDSDLIDGKEEVELKLYHIVNGESQLIDTVTTSGESTKLEAEVNHFSEFQIVAGRSVLKRGDATEKTDVTVTNFTIEHVDGSTSNEFNYYDRVKLNLDWDASSYGNTLKENDFFTVKLPNNMRFPTNHAATHFDLTAPDGTVVRA